MAKKKEKEKMIHIDGADEAQVQADATENEEVKETEAEQETAETQEKEAETAESTEAADAQAAEEEQEPAEEASDKKSRKRGKKADKKDELIEDLQDKLTRRMAEFDNFRKRTEKEKAAMYSMGAKDVLEKMLDVLDNFERGLSAVGEDEQDDAFVQGMQMVYKQMVETLEKLGVTPIEAVGKDFDPDFHNAVMHEENDEVGENTVTEEFQKGYLYHDDVIRHSMVKVAN